jgi:hypothetical protein
MIVRMLELSMSGLIHETRMRLDGALVYENG